MDVLAWLLDGDPAIRWQALRDLTDTAPDALARERDRVPVEGWGAELLGAQADDGYWDGGVYRPGWFDPSRPRYDMWSGSHFSLQQLADFAPDPRHPLVHRAIARVREHVVWLVDGAPPYFDGEGEPCVDGVALTVAARFEQDGSAIVTKLLERQLDDGGWNCEDDSSVGSMHSTICAVEGLWAWERANGGSPRSAAARHRGEEYLLERRLLFRRGTDELIDPRFGMLSYPVRWYYDSLRALDHLRLARPERDPRCAEAVALLRSRRREDGTWKLENTHEGPVWFEMEEEGRPSRWVTLRALRVLKWWDEE